MSPLTAFTRHWKNKHPSGGLFTTIGISPNEFRGNPFLMHYFLRTFADENKEIYC